MLFDGDAALAGRMRRVRCQLHPAAYEIEIEGGGAFAVSRAGGEVTVLRSAPAGDAALAAACAAPPRALGCAVRGSFCLHASAVERDGRVAAFLGLSGAGKSTLALRLAALPGGGWRRLADDVLPVALGAGGPEARPGFPQPALGASVFPERLPLAAVYLLAGPRPAVTIGPLATRDAALALVRHTVASHLFGPDLLARHLDHSAAVAAAVPVGVLAYPWTEAATPGIAAALAAAVEGRRG